MFDYKKFKIKQTLKNGERLILLLEMYMGELLPDESAANIVAVNTKRELVWIVENPKTKHDIYSNIYFEKERLFAFTAGGQLHEINTVTGKIITSRMIK